MVSLLKVLEQTLHSKTAAKEIGVRPIPAWSDCPKSQSQQRLSHHTIWYNQYNKIIEGGAEDEVYPRPGQITNYTVFRLY